MLNYTVILVDIAYSRGELPNENRRMQRKLPIHAQYLPQWSTILYHLQSLHIASNLSEILIRTYFILRTPSTIIFEEH